MLAYDDLKQVALRVDAALRAASLSATQVEIGVPDLKRLLKSIENDSEFYKGGEFQHRHLQPEDPNPRHCMCLQLSSRVDSRFRKVCQHTRSDGSLGQKPTDMKEFWEARGGRGDPDSSFWNSACEVCHDSDSNSQRGQLLCCQYCNVVAHPRCVERWHWDLPQGQDEWICPACVDDLNLINHDLGGCEQCDRQYHILQTIQRSLNALSSLQSTPARTQTEAPEDAAAAATAGSGGGERGGSSGSHAGGGRGTAAVETHTAATPGRRGSGSQHEIIELTELETLWVEFADIQEKLNTFVAHLIRTKAQSGFKHRVLEHLGEKQFYLLIDYWAKLKPTKFKNATCEGNQKGISCHGAMVIYLNPNKERRGQLQDEYLAVQSADYWSGFPPPPEDGGPRFVTEHIHLLSNDSTQDAFHTQSVLDATLKDFTADRPWLNGSRNCFCQSDQAGNYRDPTTDFNLGAIGVRCFSEANEGKDEGDSEAGRMKQGIARWRSEGNDTEDETEFLRALQASREVGGTHGTLEIFREEQDKTSAARANPVSHISNFALWTVDPDQNLTFWESLDPAEAAKGNFVGFGGGYELRAEVFRERHCRQASPTRGRLKRGEEEDSRGPRSAAAHYTVGDRQAIGKKREAATQEKKRQKIHMDEKAREEKQRLLEIDEEVGLVCQRCNRGFVTKGCYSRHMAAGSCISLARRLSTLRGQRSVTHLARATLKRMKSEEQQVLAKSGVVTSSGLGAGYSSFGDVERCFTWAEEQEQGLAVDEVRAGSMAHLEGRVGVEYRLVAMLPRPLPGAPGPPARIEVTDMESLKGACAAQRGRCFDLIFSRPPAPIPHQGCARKGIHRRVVTRLLQEQIDWLNEKVFFFDFQRIRDKEAYLMMKEAFANRAHRVTKRPLWLSQDQIASWISRRWSELKQQARERARSQVRQRQAERTGVDGDYEDIGDPCTAAEAE